jgi:vacuolar-type H+-ATPase subunit I/STV1
MLVHRHATIETIKAMVHNAPVLYVAGIIALAMGLAMVLGHNVWKGGALPVVVTLVGWLSLIKGLLILFLPARWVEACYLGCGHEVPLLYLKAAIAIIVGAYLTYAGFRAKAS